MKRRRYIVIDAAIVDHPAVRDDPPAMLLLVHLLCIAHAKPEPFDYDVDGVTVRLKQGQSFFALRHWARKVKLSHKIARRAFDKLKAAGTIDLEPIRKGTQKGTQKGTKKGTQAGYVLGTRVTLRNFASYQDFQAYGNGKGHTAREAKGHNEGHTGGNRKGHVTYSGVPTQDNQESARADFDQGHDSNEPQFERDFLDHYPKIPNRANTNRSKVERAWYSLTPAEKAEACAAVEVFAREIMARPKERRVAVIGPETFLKNKYFPTDPAAWADAEPSGNGKPAAPEYNMVNGERV